MKTKTPQGAFLFGLLVISCLVVSMTVTGCKNEPDQKSGNSITSFKIGEIAGAILEDEISVVVPTGTSLTAMSPVITLSEGANVLPASETPNDFTNPTTYAVTAENGSVRTFVVTVTSPPPAAPVVLESIQIINYPNKIDYQKGEALDITGLVVRGYYSDGSSKDETVTLENVSNYNADRVAEQNLLVTVGGKTTTLRVNVYPADVTSSLNLTAGLIKDGDDEITIYGIPAEGIILSVDKNDNRYDTMTISMGASSYNVYSNINWQIDGGTAITNNILTIDAGDYTYTIPHTITIRATKDGVEYSKNITFTVVR